MDRLNALAVKLQNNFDKNYKTYCILNLISVIIILELKNNILKLAPYMRGH